MFNAAEDLIPKNLDDLIRKNRELLRLEYVNFEDLYNLSHSINIDNPKGFLEEVFLYKRITKLSFLAPICVVGYLKTDSARCAYHTSEVKFIDINRNAFVTASGSQYLIESFADRDKIDTTLLFHICHISHRDGWGSHFDVPHIYY